MQRSILALSLLTILSGCDSDESAPDTKPVEDQPRLVDISILQETVGDMSAQSIVWQTAETQNYTVVIDELDDGGETRTIKGVTITESTYPIEVIGAAEVRIFHPNYNSGEAIYSGYALDGFTSIGAHQTSTSVSMNNERFSHIVVHNNGDTYGARINGKNAIYDDQDFYHGYVIGESTLAVDTREGVIARNPEGVAAKRYQYELVTNETGGIDLKDRWGNGDIQEPVDPAVDSKNVVGATIIGSNLDTGETVLYINGKNSALSSPSIALPVERATTLGQYSWNVDIETGYGQYVNIYLNGSCKSSDGGHIVFDVDNNKFYSNDGANETIGYSWDDVIGNEDLGIPPSKYADDVVSVCTEFPIGNFYLRLSPEDMNYGASFSIYSYNIAK